MIFRVFWIFQIIPGSPLQSYDVFRFYAIPFIGKVMKFVEKRNRQAT